MSSFSEYLNEIKQYRNLTIAQIADLCNINKAVVFRWFNGSHLPDSLGRLKVLTNQLRLTAAEAEKLRQAYDREVLGEIHCERFRHITDIFRILEQKRAEYMGSASELYLLPENMRKDTGAGSLQNTMLLNSKLDVLQCIQNELTRAAASENRHICLKTQSLPEVLLMQLKSFCNRMTAGSLELLIGIPEGSYDACTDKLEIIKGALALMLQKDFAQIYWYRCREQAGQGGQNWLMTHDFFLQFSEDLSDGFLCRDPEWIDFFHSLFDEAKECGAPILRDYTKTMDGLQRYMGMPFPQKPEYGCSIEYMPCLSFGMTEEIIRRHMYRQLPRREELIRAILALCREQAENMEVYSLFVGDGLEEFMETGRVDLFPRDLYAPFDMQARRQMLCNILELAEENPKLHYMRLREDFPNLKGVYVEDRVQNGHRLIVEVHFDHLENEQIEITDEEVKQEIKFFMEYLINNDYTYSQEETRAWMQAVLEKYEERDA